MDVAKTAVFITTWTAVTVSSGMREVAKKAQRLRLNGTAAKKRLDILTKEREVRK